MRVRVSRCEFEYRLRHQSDRKEVAEEVEESESLHADPNHRPAVKHQQDPAQKTGGACIQGKGVFLRGAGAAERRCFPQKGWRAVSIGSTGSIAE